MNNEDENNENKSKVMEIAGLTVRLREPETGDTPHPLILMLHGWTGDERSMWIFTSRLPDNALLIAPRGLYKAPWGGYSWYEAQTQRLPSFADLKPAINRLLDLLKPEHFPDADLATLRVVGFSQGAALTYTFGLLHPDMVRCFAGLSGFLPDGAEEVIKERPLVDKDVFITHGSQDTIVDVSKARNAVEKMERAGAQVTYCEDDVGHKLSLTCFKALETFFECH